MNEPTPTAPLIEQFQSATRASSAIEARMLAERMLRGSELALEAARHDAREATQACEELSVRILGLEEALEQARRAPDELTRQIADERRGRRLAEQQAFAERARREELQAELAEAQVERDPAAEQADRQAVREHERELQAEIRELRRRADELEHLAVAAAVARDRAESQLAGLRAESAGAPLPGRIPLPDAGRPLADEFAVAARAAAGSSALQRVASVAAPSAGRGPAELALERELTHHRRSDSARSAPVAAPSAGSADPVLRTVASLSASVRLAPALAELREELSTLSAIVQRERAARLVAEERVRALEVQLAEQVGRSARAYEAIEGLRGRLAVGGGWGAQGSAGSGSESPSAGTGRVLELAGRLPEAPVEPTSKPASESESESEAGAAPVVVEPERFTDALTRLREATPARESEPAHTTPAGQEAAVSEASPASAATAAGVASRRGWLHRTLRELVRRDPATAGQFLLELLPAQRFVHPQPVAYDLELSPERCVQVTVTAEAQTLECAGGARPTGETDFVVYGDAASLARLLSAGWIRRRLRHGMPRIRGDRRQLGVLDELVRAPLSLNDLRAAGVRFEPGLTLAVVAAMIDPGWTRGSRFELAYRAGADDPVSVLTVRDGAPVQTGETLSEAATTAVLTVASDELLALFDGVGAESIEIDGDPVALTKLQSWVKRAQSG